MFSGFSTVYHLEVPAIARKGSNINFCGLTIYVKAISVSVTWCGIKALISAGTAHLSDSKAQIPLAASRHVVRGVT